MIPAQGSAAVAVVRRQAEDHRERQDGSENQCDRHASSLTFEEPDCIRALRDVCETNYGVLRGLSDQRSSAKRLSDLPDVPGACLRQVEVIGPESWPTCDQRRYPWSRGMSPSAGC